MEASRAPCVDGYGHCFRQCWCTCSEITNPDADSEEDTEYLDVCTCGHRAHDIHFPNSGGGACCPASGCGSCVMEPCWVCRQPAPKCLLSSQYGCCGANCAIESEVWFKDTIGPVTEGEVAECPICYEDKVLYKLQTCGHEFCHRCLLKTAHAKQAKECSLCRRSNEATDLAETTHHNIGLAHTVHSKNW
mmetsp:Transcript_8348/g.13120  ORF Transcript_8348/g.13120 Transcript_8348/m.13120 type:complete len:190 (+) Transcript_8348:482-1051(+)